MAKNGRCREHGVFQSGSGIAGELVGFMGRFGACLLVDGYFLVGEAAEFGGARLVGSHASSFVGHAGGDCAELWGFVAIGVGHFNLDLDIAGLYLFGTY